MGKTRIQKQIGIFTQRVKTKIPNARLILFGSYVKGEANQYSDIDILVISDTFLKMKQKKRFDMLYSMAKGIYPDINAFGFTPDEVVKINPLTTLSDALKTGQVIS